MTDESDFVQIVNPLDPGILFSISSSQGSHRIGLHLSAVPLLGRFNRCDIFISPESFVCVVPGLRGHKVSKDKSGHHHHVTFATPRLRAVPFIVYVWKHEVVVKDGRITFKWPRSI